MLVLGALRPYLCGLCVEVFIFTTKDTKVSQKDTKVSLTVSSPAWGRAG